MSGIEVAGIVLAVIPLIISALEDYKAGTSRYAAFFQHRIMLDNLLHRLRTQRVIFYAVAKVLLRAAGIEDDRIGSELDCANTLQTNDVAAKIKDYLGVQYDSLDEIVREHEKCLKLIAGTIVDIRRLPKTKADDLRALVEANPQDEGSFNFRQRIKFVLNRSKLKDLIDTLNDKNNDLDRLINLRVLFDTVLTPPSVEASSFVSHLHEIQSVARSLCSAIASGWVPGCHVSHTALIQIEDRVRRSHARRGKSLRPEPVRFELFFSTSDGRWCQVLVSWDGNVNATHSTGPASPRQHVPKLMVICEDGHSRHAIDSVHPDDKRVLNMCVAIHKARGTDSLLTLALDSDFLYHSPEVTHDLCSHEISSTSTLERILLEIVEDNIPQMSLLQRSYLALCLASSVLQLHGTDWLHQPWSKGSIQFFPNVATQPPRLDIDRPMIAQCFPNQGDIPSGFSNQAGVKEALLELSILLLEIWHQKPLDIWAKNQGYLDVNSSDTRKLAVVQWYEATSNLIIPLYTDAIEACLQICAGRRRQWDETEFVKSVYENVIKPLAKNYDNLAIG